MVHSQLSSDLSVESQWMTEVAKADGWLWQAISKLVPLGTGDEMELNFDPSLTLDWP